MSALRPLRGTTVATRKGTPEANNEKASTPAADEPAAPAAAARFPIVGLGASAGGLEAFEQFFNAMPADSNMGFVLIQHLDPSHPSILAEILQRSTKMPVVEAQDQMVVMPNRVHVIPPNRDMVIFDGALQLSTPSEPRGQRMPVDAFLRSLAEDQGDSAVGIILSGTGTDGTLGLRAVFGAGGLCLAQDPATAKYDGMPSSAARAGYANRVLPVEKMPQALRDGTRPLPIRQAVAVASPSPVAGAASGLNKILMQLRSGTGHDFSQYKKSTIGRRIERRMAQHNIEDEEVYARYLKEHPAEVQTLFRELLINVTSFFRDPQAFAVLKNDILPPMLDDKTEGSALRVWVAGCATGEEAYSIAILLREAMEEMQREFKVQLYSTDLDDEAIVTARVGLYPPNIAQDMQPERLRRYFIKEDAGYRIKKEIREMVVFAVQSVIEDPPFTRLDLLACRNLMIYLEPELQNRLIPSFHYALKPGGVLFLSPSESVGMHAELFEPIDRKWKFYRARPSMASALAARASELPWTVEADRQPRPDARVSSKGTQLAELARRSLLQSFAPAAVVTDMQGNILYVHGDTGRFLRPAPGQPTHSLVEMAREGLELELREALRRAASQGQPTLNRPLQVKSDDKTLPVSLSVRLLPDPDTQHPVLLVSFQELASAPLPKAVRRPRAGSSAAEQRIDELQRELAYAKDSLKALLEEQQASNEELKSTNEEMQSTNEELQSTNEELETSKEELQSVNEELVTVNSELQIKIEQMAGMQDDMKNLLDNIHIGTIFLDRKLTIRRYTRDATKAYRLMANDVGRPLADIRCELEGADLLADAQVVLDSLVPVEREVSAAGGRWYLARIQPYRTVDNVIDGVVLTFADVTERVLALAVRKARDLAEAIVDAVHDPLVVLDDTLHVVSVNRSYCREYGGDMKNAAGQAFFDIGDGRWDFAAMHDLLENVLAHERQFEGRTLEHESPTLGRQRVQVSGRRIGESAGADAFVLLVIEPCTNGTA
jgi:two-component system, chemotaxis family, CheB/CheR fusion protein